MTREEFAAHVREIEKRYASRPRALRARVVWLAMVGYAGMLAWLGTVIFFAALFFVPGVRMPLDGGWLLMLIGALILTIGGWAVMRVLWVRLTPPEGRLVSPREVPALHAMLTDLRRRLRSTGFYRVIITPDCNAMVCEVPRLGVLGWPRHYLQIGLPLLECLSADEVRAVLAHECAHLSARDGRVSSWLYRLRRSWDQIFAKLREPYVRGSVSLRPLLVKFIEWFWPRFDAHAFVHSRSKEFKADATAAWVAGAEPMASALYRIEVYAHLLSERFWPDVWQRANTEPNPPTGILEEMRAKLRVSPSPEDDAKWRAQAFKFVTSDTDTHPCLSARLRAIKRLPEGVEAGEYPAWPAISEPSGAEALLGDALGKIRTDVEARWRKDCQQTWTDRHARAAALQHRLQSLSQAVPEPAADVDSLWDQAHAMIDLKGDVGAVPILQQILALRPTHAGANFCLGRHLIGEGDATGEAHLERAMEEDEDLIPKGCGLLHAFFRRTGNASRVREVEARLDRYEAAMAASHQERANVTAADTLIPHGLEEAQLDGVRALLAGQPGVARAYLGQKQMRHFKKQRLFVLCIEGKRAWYRPANHDAEQSAVKALFGKLRLPGRVLVFAPSGSFSAIAKKLRTVPNAQIFARQGQGGV
jgi:Zn-dependent protease with chaperone function